MKTRYDSAASSGRLPESISLQRVISDRYVQPSISVPGNSGKQDDGQDGLRHAFVKGAGTDPAIMSCRLPRLFLKGSRKNALRMVRHTQVAKLN